ncbi:MAG: FAD-binding protein, partial [Oscillospiraceae bacterium]
MDDFALLTSELVDCMPELELRKNEPMKNHCSFRIGGEAAVMALPSSTAETEKLCKFLRKKGVKPLIIGNGTNLLVTDAPLRRFVIRMAEGMSTRERRGDTDICALCGVSLAKLAAECAHFSLTGLEFAHGIPGTLGGAVCMNAGAYGGEMKMVVRSVTFLDVDLVLREKPIEELDFTYRHTAFSDTE